MSPLQHLSQMCPVHISISTISLNALNTYFLHKHYLSVLKRRQMQRAEDIKACNNNKLLQHNNCMNQNGSQTYIFLELD